MSSASANENRDGQDLGSIFQSVAFAGLITSLFVVFVPAFTLLLLQSSEVPWWMWLTILLPIVFCVIAVGFPPSTRIWMLNGFALLFLAVQVIIVQPYGPAWFPLPFAAFAVTFGAAFSLSVTPALTVIVLAAILNILALWRPAGQLIMVADGLAGRSIGPIFVVVAGLGMVGVAQGWRRVANVSDTRTRDIELATEAAYRDVQVQSVKTSIERRIHETILNTLNAIAHGWNLEADLVRRECRRDIEQLDLGTIPTSAKTLRETINEATNATAGSDVTLQVSIDQDFEMQSHTATALRDALVEALRNADRHANATAVTILTRVDGDSLTLEVKDDGVGFSPDASERFGLRNTIRASIAAVGGDATIANPDEGGATVRINLPLGAPVELQLPADPAMDILFKPFIVRLSLLAIIGFGLLMLPWIATSFPNPSPVFVVLYLLYAVANLVLAIVWNSKWRVPASALVAAAFVAVYISTHSLLTSCEAAPSAHWVLNTVAGGLALLLFASYGRFWFWTIVPTMALLGLWVLLTLPEACRGFLIMPLISPVIYQTAAMYLIVVILRASDEQRLRATRLWVQATAQRAEVERQIMVTSQWSRVSTTTRTLLSEIADGILDVKDPAVRLRAASEEGQLRANLGMRSDINSALWQDVLGVVQRAADQGLSVDADCIQYSSTDVPLPAAVINVLDEIIAVSPTMTVSIRMFVDKGVPEIMCICKEEAARRAWVSAFGDGPLKLPAITIVEGAAKLEFDAMEGDLACLSIRQERV